MAGNGTKESPFIVHNYDEIKSWDTFTEDEDTVYLKLDNDIDCNDYGDTWEWTSIGVFNYKNEKQRSLDLDLNGHTIKNILIKKDSYLFSTGSTSTSDYFVDGTAKVHNGKILNIFNSSASNLVNTNGFFTLFNLSISANIANLQKDVFSKCRIENCSIYLKAGYWNTNRIFYTTAEANDAILKNSDFLLDMRAPQYFYACNTATKIIADGCRIVQIGSAYEESSSSIRPFYNGRCNNCVFDVNYKNTSSGIYAYVFGNSSSVNTGIYNKTHLIGTVSDQGMIRCTDAEIKSGDSLLEKNFAVIKED